MESSEIAKRLSLLEDQKNLLLRSFSTASGIANGTITGGQDGTWIEVPKKQGNNLNHYLFSRDDDSNSYSSETGSQEYEYVQTEKLTFPRNMVNAEDTLVETMSWSALELRVHHLEKSVYGFDPLTKKHVVHNKLKYTVSLLKHIDEIKKQFQTIVRERDGLKTFFEQYDQLSPHVSPFRDAVDLERAVLTPEAKAEIIVASEESLKAVAENLNQIEELQGIIDAEEFKGLEKLFPLVTPIETLHVKQSAQSNEVSARINQLMDRYNAIVNTLSEIFIAWDSILTTIEANIASLEREKARG